MVDFADLSDAALYAARLKGLRKFLPWASRFADTQNGNRTRVTVVVEPGTAWESPAFSIPLEPLIDRAFAEFEVARHFLETLGVRDVPDHNHFPPRKPIQWPSSLAAEQEAGAESEEGGGTDRVPPSEELPAQVVAAMVKQTLDQALRATPNAEALAAAVRRASALLIPLVEQSEHEVPNRG